MLTLQYWVESGACGTSLVEKAPIKYCKKHWRKDPAASKVLLQTEDNDQTRSALADSQKEAAVAKLLANQPDSEDDFQELVLPRKRRRIVKAVIEDDSPDESSHNSPAKYLASPTLSLTTVPEEDSQSNLALSAVFASSQGMGDSSGQDNELEVVAIGDTTTGLHRLCLESVVAISGAAEHNTALHVSSTSKSHNTSALHRYTYKQQNAFLSIVVMTNEQIKIILICFNGVK